MKITTHVSLAFKDFRFSEKNFFGAGVINALSGTNKDGEPVINFFPNLPVPLNELKSINDKVGSDLAKARTGLYVAKASLRKSIQAWDNAFSLTARYVNFIAQGSASLILLAGFSTTKTERLPKPKPQMATSFKATIGSNRKSITAGIKKAVDDAAAYVFAAVPDGVNINYNDKSMIIEVEGKQIFINAVTKKKTDFYNMPAGVVYKVSMYAINNAGMGSACNGEHVIPQ